MWIHGKIKFKHVKSIKLSRFEGKNPKIEIIPVKYSMKIALPQKFQTSDWSKKEKKNPLSPYRFSTFGRKKDSKGGKTWARTSGRASLAVAIIRKPRVSPRYRRPAACVP